MWRIVVIIGFTLSLLAVPQAAEAQHSRKIWRIGYLTPTELPRSTLIDPLRELGYVEGQTSHFEIRTAQDNLERLPALAAELVRAQVDVIVAAGPPAIRAAKQATSTIPIVMAFWGGEGLLESGVVASFARPGGNVTGIYMLTTELNAKRCEFLLQLVPQARMVGVLNPGGEWSLKHLEHFAETHKITLRLSDVPGPQGYDAAFAAMRRSGVDAVLVPSLVRFFREHLLIIEAAAKHRLPTIYEWGDMARAGGLMGYGPVQADINRRVANYVHRILTGAQPASLPVEQPTRFELVVNRNSADALGLTLPHALRVQIDDFVR